MPKKAGAKTAGSVSGDFIVMAPLIGISRVSSLVFTLGGVLLMVVALAGVVAVPLGLRLLEIPAQSAAAC